MSAPSCPHWPELLAHRLDGDGWFVTARPEPPGFAAALEHLHDCASCRELALGLDPTLVFHFLPAPAIADAEVARMRAAVGAAVRAEQTVRREAAGRRPPPPAWRRPARWAAAAASVLLVTALATTQLSRWRPTGSEAVAVGTPTGSAVAAAAGGEVRLAALPLIEDLDLPEPTVYQLETDGLSVVMIVDPSLDV